MNGLDFLRAAIFPVKTNFSRLPNFLKYYQADFSSIPFDFDVVIEKLNYLISTYTMSMEIIDADDALKVLMSEDLKRIKQSVINNRLLIEGDTDFSSSLLQCRDDCVRLLQEVGLPIEPPNIYIVKDFPPPFERTSFAAMAPDAFDEKNYGIPRGLYFKESSLLPIYSRFLLVHEIIHSVLGQLNPEYMGRGLEEGLAEIVGALYLGSRILGKEITKNAFYHNRLGYGINQFWQLYLDYARMGTYLYNRFGMDGLVSMIKQGRGKIKQVEKLCFQGNYDAIDLPAGRWMDDVTNLVNYITLTFSRDFVVSPLAYYVANYINEGDKIDIISQKSKVPSKLVDDAVRELQDRVFVLLYSNNTVDISDVKMLMDAGAIRYEV